MSMFFTHVSLYFFSFIINRFAKLSMNMRRIKEEKNEREKYKIELNTTYDGK